MDKLRLRFEKTDRAVYISHLDLMHTMQRAFSRAGYELKYSEGFNPHPQISIALPLSVGASSLCEILDFKLSHDADISEIPAKLSAVMPEGIKIVDVQEPVHKANEIAAAEYEIVTEFLSEGEAEGFAAGAQSVIDSGVLNAEKRSKRGIKTVNLCEMIRSFECKVNANRVETKAVLAAGNTVNLNAELLMNALFAEFAAEPEKNSISRTKLLRTDLSLFG